MANKHFKRATLSFADPGEIDIDDADQVYGDGWPDIDDPCDDSPNGHHEFNCGMGADPEICIHCGRRC